MAPQVRTDGEIPAVPLRLYGDGTEVFSALVSGEFPLPNTPYPLLPRTKLNVVVQVKP